MTSNPTNELKYGQCNRALEKLTERAKPIYFRDFEGFKPHPPTRRGIDGELSSSLQKDLLALKLNNRAVGDIRFEPCCSSQDARPSTSERSAESQKAVVFDNACWSVVNIPAPTAPVLRQSIALKRFLPQRRRFITLSSGLIIKIESGTHYFDKMVSMPTSGYTEAISQKALKRFVERGIFRIVSKRVSQTSDNGQYSAEMVIDVPKHSIEKARFCELAASKQLAERKCCLKILNALYSTDMIKDAGLELHRRRKEFMDPSKKLGIKLRTYLNCNPLDFSAILDDIEKDDTNFC